MTLDTHILIALLSAVFGLAVGLLAGRAIWHRPMALHTWGVEAAIPRIAYDNPDIPIYGIDEEEDGEA